MNAANDRSAGFGERCAVDELAAMRRRFVATVGGWGLSETEAARLLGLEGCWRRDALSPDAEARMRMLAEVDGLLAQAVGTDRTAEWLREPNPAFVGGLTPLEAMSLGRTFVRQIRNALAALAYDS